jgi:hypothetical protein
VADIANNVIRDSGGNRIMGTGTAGFSGDGGQAINAKLNHPSAVVVRGNFLYIADSGNNRIRRVDLNSHIITTIAGNGQSGYSGDNGNALGAKFNAPGGLTFDPAGNLYISDTGNDVIRRLDF